MQKNSKPQYQYGLLFINLNHKTKKTMKTFDLVKELNLLESEGWFYIPFIAGNNSSFYNLIIENESITLAWVAVQKTLNIQAMATHHFKRENNTETGIRNSMPRILIVTDGRKWFISQPGSEKFNHVRYAKVLMIMYQEIKSMISNVKTCAISQKVLSNLTKTMGGLMIEVKKYGEIIAEGKKDNHVDAFCGSGQTRLDIKSDIMPDILLNSESEQASSYSILLHQLLFRSVNLNQLHFLMKFPDNDIYVNPLCKMGRMHVCITKHLHKTEEGLIKHKPLFFIVDKYGNPKAFFPNKEAVEKGIVPNLLKINLELVNEFLTKEAF